jgi:hypothetical protein
MRGFAVPSESERLPYYWDSARILLDEINPHTFLEWLLLGPDRNVRLHLLIPTQWGFLLNETRMQKINTVISQHGDKLAVLKKQQDHLLCCVKCLKSLEEHQSKPYQVVIRIASGQSVGDVWNYDFFFGFFCFDCQTVKTCALFLSSEAIYGMLSQCISRYAFSEAFAPVNKKHYLMDAYLERFILLNQFEEQILEDTMHVSKYCYHCGEQKRRIQPCELCGIIRFCTKGTCREKAFKGNYHQDHLCKALRERSLFHVDEALFISEAGELQEARRFVRI